MTDRTLLRKPIRALLEERPYLEEFFAALPCPAPHPDQTPEGWLAGLESERLEEAGLAPEDLESRLLDFVAQMEAYLDDGSRLVEKVTLLGGRDKKGRPEDIRLELRRGEVVCVVGPTGSGKSRLLGDIECLAQGDTPSGRRILLDDAPPDDQARLSGEQRLVAQLSQNMNFVMDLTVEEFLALHAESRLVENVSAMVEQIYRLAIELAGEPFTLDTAVTALSGGQSRALMIADVACLSASPIVLIDEIENAGVDRRRALELLVQKEKIVIMATHDPLLALSGDRRLVIRNGAIAAVVETSEEERMGLERLDALDRRLSDLRDRVRRGERIDFDLTAFLLPD